jgi:hypothetical protein
VIKSNHFIITQIQVTLSLDHRQLQVRKIISILKKDFMTQKKNLGHFLRKSFIKYEDRLIEGDSLYYDRNKEFASATRNVKNNRLC